MAEAEEAEAEAATGSEEEVSANLFEITLAGFPPKCYTCGQEERDFIIWKN